MKTVSINGKKLPSIGLGTWHMGDQIGQRPQELAALQAGISAGASVIDTAEMYGNGRSEKLVGEAIRNMQRDSLYLISKVLPENASAKRLPQRLDRSLMALGTDYLDLYLLHWRGTIPLSETVQALEDAKQAGKIRAWGVSNFDVDDLQELLSVPHGENVSANEVLFNLQNRGPLFDLLPWQQQHQLPLIAYSPIAQGDQLGGQLRQNKTLQAIALAHQTTVFTIMLAWVVDHPQVLAIPQTSQRQHALANVAAGEIQLTDQERQQLTAAFPTPTRKQPLAVL